MGYDGVGHMKLNRARHSFEVGPWPRLWIERAFECRIRQCLCCGRALLVDSVADMSDPLGRATLAHSIPRGRDFGPMLSSDPPPMRGALLCGGAGAGRRVVLRTRLTLWADPPDDHGPPVLGRCGSAGARRRRKRGARRPSLGSWRSGFGQIASGPVGCRAGRGRQTFGGRGKAARLGQLTTLAEVRRSRLSSRCSLRGGLVRPGRLRVGGGTLARMP